MIDYSGHRFGRYRLIKLIGDGGFGHVYLAWDGILRRYVAIKVPKGPLTRKVQNDLLSEARLLSLLAHPHIVGVYDFALHDGTIPYMVMAYAHHGSLLDQHPHGEILPWDTILGYLRQICLALDYIHQCGYIYQDVKPGNFLLDKNNHILIGDFGIVTAIDNIDAQSDQTPKGTVTYVSPERFRGEKCTAASDVYSLAVMVYEWATGRALFCGSTTEIIQQHLNVPPPTRPLDVAGVLPAVQTVLLKALAKDPLDRHQSTQEFVADLSSAISLSAHSTQAETEQTESMGQDEPREQIGQQSDLLSVWFPMTRVFLFDVIVLASADLIFNLTGAQLTIIWFIMLSLLVLFPMPCAVLQRNWRAVMLSVAAPLVALLFGIVLPWLNFWWTLPFLFFLCFVIESNSGNEGHNGYSN
jgi:serine/threonine protein kinase